MNRYSRISTIWRKELTDTLRDRRTVIAMVLVPMVLYPALMLGSLHALEVQVGFLVQEEYTVAVASPDVERWLREVIDGDVVRRARRAALGRDGGASLGLPEAHRRSDAEARADVRDTPPGLRIVATSDPAGEVRAGAASVGVALSGPPPTGASAAGVRVALIYDESEIRSRIALSALQGILERAGDEIVSQRLRHLGLSEADVKPLATFEHNVASPEKMAGSALGQIVPLILILMTITGAIYPAIDLTAGERERGTLETLMVAPVPALDLIAGKFIVVTLVGLMSALLNLVSIAGTIYLGGFGEMLAGGEFAFPLSALPWTLLLLIPLAVMFSATLLAVCSFARSFKEAQNYVVPVMIAAMIPGVAGVLPGTRLEGPIVVMPVANVVVLTRDLFMGRFDPAALTLVLMSTSLYAAAAIAIAGRLFGQEAVLFSDAGSIRTLFQRRFFKPSDRPTAAAALLVLTVAYTVNFYLQQSLHRAGLDGQAFVAGSALTLFSVLGLGSLFAARYTRVNIVSAFALRAPPARALLAGLCFGGSTWVLAPALLAWQQRWFPLDPVTSAELSRQSAFLDQVNPWVLVYLLAVVPALVEEAFFRGYVLGGLRTTLGKAASVVLVALAFALFHYSAHRLAVTGALGLLLGLLVVQHRSVWPAVLAHAMHNALAILSQRSDGLLGVLRSVGYVVGDDGPPVPFVVVAGVVALLGILLCLRPRADGGEKSPRPSSRAAPVDGLSPRSAS